MPIHINIGRTLVEIDINGELRILLCKNHIQDLLWFHESVRIKIRKNWNWRNQKIRDGDWATTSFLYLKAPSKELNVEKNNFEGIH
ncbi:MAG: hypothetical protein AAGG59_02155 [Bacteroidota bacterium]